MKSNKIRKDVFFGSMGVVTIDLLQLVISVIIARALGPEGRGTYSLIVGFTGILSFLVGLNTASANSYLAGSRKFPLSDLLGGSIIMMFVTWLFAIIVGFLLVYFDAPFIRGINPNQLYFVLLVYPFALSQNYFRGILIGTKNYVKTVRADVTGFLLSVTTLSLCFLFGWISLWAAVITWGLIAVTTTTMNLYSVTREIPNHLPSFNRKALIEQIRYGARSYFAKTMTWVNNTSDIYIGAMFLTKAEIGYYVTAFGLANKLWIVPNSLGASIVSRIAEAPDGKPQLLKLSSQITFFITLVLGFLLATFGYLIIYFLYSKKFSASYIPLLLMLPGIVFKSISLLMMRQLQGTNRPTVTSTIAIVSAGTHLGLNFVFIPLFSFNGMAIASSVASLLEFALLFYMIRKTTGYKLTELLFLDANAKAYLMSALKKYGQSNRYTRRFFSR